MKTKPVNVIGDLNELHLRFRRRFMSSVFRKFPTTFEWFDEESILKYFGNSCAACAKEFVRPFRPQLEQIIPAEDFGEPTNHNTICICSNCRGCWRTSGKSLECWMRWSPVIRRNHTEDEIERRVKHLFNWIGSYRAGDPRRIFGRNYEAYLGLMARHQEVIAQSIRLLAEMEDQFLVDVKIK